MALHMIARFGDWYDALPWREQTLLDVGVIIVTAAIVFLAVQVFAYVMVRSLRREIRGPWHLNDAYQDAYHDTYCRHCEMWVYTDRTACTVCDFPLQVFPDDPIARAAAEAQHYALPPVKTAQPAFAVYRGGRVS